MAKQLVLSESGRLETHDGDPITLTALLGGAEVEGFTQTYSTATTTVPAIEAAAPAAATYAAPTQAQAAITGGESPTETEFNTLRTDLVSTNAKLAALAVDVAANTTILGNAVTGITTNRKLINALIDYLQAAEDS